MTKNALVSKGFSVANYIAGGDGLDERADLGTLNLSDVPVVMVELGNMRDSGDAAVMTSAKGQGATRGRWRSRYAPSSELSNDSATV